METGKWQADDIHALAPPDTLPIVPHSAETAPQGPQRCLNGPAPSSFSWAPCNMRVQLIPEMDTHLMAFMRSLPATGSCQDPMSGKG